MQNYYNVNYLIKKDANIQNWQYLLTILEIIQ